MGKGQAGLMRKVIGIITARMASTRLPGKVMYKLANKPVFAHHVQRMKEVNGLDGIFLATSVDSRNKVLIEEAERLGCGWYAGSEQDIVGRHENLCKREGADAFIRVTCDCPLFDIDSASQYVELFKKDFYDYLYVSNMPIIHGTVTELVSRRAIEEVHKHYRGAAITLYIKENLAAFKTRGIDIDDDLCRSEYRLTLDEQADYEVLQHIYEALYRNRPLSLHEVYVWLDDNPQIAKINSQVEVKGCNLIGTSLSEKFLYSIVSSGNKYIILDEQKRHIAPENFLSKMLEIFPELKIGSIN